MSNAESESTSTLNRDLEKADSHPSLVAVSEENLAALLRATLSSGEPEAALPAESPSAAGRSELPESSAQMREPRADRAATVTPPPANLVESRLALFASVKENRSAISQSESARNASLLSPRPAGALETNQRPAQEFESVTAAPPTKVVPAVVALRETAPIAAARAKSVASPPETATAPEQSPKESRSRLVIGLVMGAVIATVGVSTFLVRSHSSKAASLPPVAQKENVPPQVRTEPPLQVRVEPLGNGVVDVRWNSQGATIAQARDGRLVITEHNQQPRTMALSAEQLKTGHLTYQSAAESIEFDLEVADRSGAIAKESILALQAAAGSAQPTKTSAQAQSGNTATPSVQNVTNLTAKAEAVESSQSKVRPFIPPAVAQSTTGERAFIDAPPTLTNAPVKLPEVGLTVPVAVISPPSNKDAAGQQQLRVESNVEAANLIKRVIPTYPALAKSTRIQGTVRFNAHIGKDGRILDLKFISGPVVLVSSASAAVMQWLYRPTLLNGKPVEVLTQIDVNFTLHETTR